MQKMDSLRTIQNNTSDSVSAQNGQIRGYSESNPESNDSVIMESGISMREGDSVYFFGRNQNDSSIIPNFTTPFIDSIASFQTGWEGLHMAPRTKNYPGNDWLTAILFVAFIILASVKAGYSKYLTTLFQSLANYSTSFRMFREKNYTIFHGAFRLEVLFYLIFSVYIFQVMVMVSPGDELFTALFFGKTLVAVVVYFLLKKLAYHALGSIFIDANDTREYLFNMDNFNRGAGIVLFPVVALIAYSPFESPMIAVFLGVLTVVFFYLMLLKRGISILLKKQFPIFYLFLYLCTLEFLPLLLIYKIVVD
jgi:hypothetical protein